MELGRRHFYMEYVNMYTSSVVSVHDVMYLCAFSVCAHALVCVYVCASLCVSVSV